METSITNTSITEGQKKQYKRFVEDAAERALGKVGLDKYGIQKLIENGDEFQARIIAGIRELSVSRQFAYEEVQSSHVYPKGYKVKGIAEQIDILFHAFPGLNPTIPRAISLLQLPPNAEGWFAIPRWEKIASTYNEALEKVLAAIKTQRKDKFCNWREGQLGPQCLRQTTKTAKAFQKLGEEQKVNDILVVPAQFGLRHRGRSARRAREVMNASEFGLGAFAVGIMLLTHPGRLVDNNDLGVDCAGDEYSPGAGGWFPNAAPYFRFADVGLRFGAYWSDRPFDSCGSASGFVSSLDP